MSAFRRFIDLLFPLGEPPIQNSEVVGRGLEALRRARDERSIVMGRSRRVPGRLELRLPQGLYDELATAGGIRDVEFFLNDELMKDLRAEAMKTFGDAPVYVTVAVDATLPSNEITATVLVPESEETHTARHSLVADDRTVAPGLNHDASQINDSGYVVRHRLIVRKDGRLTADIAMMGRHWIVGRKGASGSPLPEGYRKIEIDFEPTISREQLRVDMIDTDRFRIQRIGQGRVRLADGGELAPEENRLIAPGVVFAIEDYELSIAQGGT